LESKERTRLWWSYGFVLESPFRKRSAVSANYASEVDYVRKCGGKPTTRSQASGAVERNWSDCVRLASTRLPGS